MARFGRRIRKTRTFRNVFMAWMVVVALCVQILMPLSSALAFDVGAGGEFQVICTANGIRTIAIDLDGVPIDPADMLSCPLCVMHAVSGIFNPQEIAVAEIVIHVVRDFSRPNPCVRSSIWCGPPRSSRAPPLSV